MRIEKVTAYGFGPLAGQTLECAPGLTVVTGDNESGKSSWHAATFAALCGRRRGRGRGSAQEQRFAEAHQPWGGGPWAVSCIVTLDDGRQIELRHDLSGKVDCRATDTALARDVSAEIMVDGSPDAAAWLGLTRSSFRASAWVGQAEVLSVLEAADGLQHSLQQAASTAGTSGTAAGAIGLLEDCRRTAVGRDNASAVRPLRKARDTVAAAELRLTMAEQAREQFAELIDQQAKLQADVASAELQVAAAAESAAEVSEALQAAAHRAALAQRPAAPPAWSAAATRRGKWAAVATMVIAAVLLVLADVTRSAVLAGCAVVSATAGGWGWIFRMRRWPAAGSVDLPADGEYAPPSRELAELRMEWSERQALAERARRRHHEAALRAARAEAVRVERGSALPSVAEAEEVLAAARRELVRVQQLDEVLGMAVGYLSRAQERVHREIVPELTGLLRAWLPRLTAGRYVDVRLDPALLAVEVCGPTSEFRRAELLSHGTAEQIYLLLRVALASRLTAGHDTCPLLLDDVTVHADPGRARRLLDLLRELSSERQIVLFSHQEQVREWARDQLDGERDALVILETLQPP